MKLRSFQKSDLARAALVDGLVMGWDTGLGKTWAMFLWPLLKVGYTHGPAGLEPKAPILVIAPGDLHDNILSEAQKHFRIQPTRLTSQDHLLSLIRRDAGGKPVLPPGFYLASYTEVCTNGVQPFPDLEGVGVREFMREWCLPLAHGVNWYEGRGTRFAACYERLGASPQQSLPELESAARRAIAMIEAGSATPEYKRTLVGEVHTALTTLSFVHCDLRDAAFAHLPLKKQDWCLAQFATEWLAAGRDALGLTQAELEAQQDTHRRQADDPTVADAPLPAHGSGPRCIHSPALADLASDLFACVVLDEGVRMKGDTTLIGQGIRKLRPQYRLVMTGTPIKNRLPDIFWLITWATGLHPDGTPRWPFPATNEAKNDFADEFMVTETNLTAAAKAGKAKKRDKRFTKATPEVCQLHRLYKLLGPNLLRRRKDDIGEDIVKKVYRSVPVPMGTEQAQVYAHHLAAGYYTGPLGARFKNPMMQLTALRQAAAAPHSANLVAQPDSKVGQARSRSRWTPRLATALSLIRDALQAGDQMVVFSAFHEASETLGRCLEEAGVPYARLDGDVTPKRRGRLSEQFKAGLTAPPEDALPVALCGIEATAEGHNWWRAGQVLRYDKSLALDKNEQSVNRAHRLTSPKDVIVWDMEVEGTTDAKLTQLSKDKGDAADLVLDGRLMGDRPEEVSPAALLNLAADLFAAGAKTIDEAIIEAGWPQLRAELKAAYLHWRSLAQGAEPAPGSPLPAPRSPLPAPGSPLPAPCSPLPAPPHPPTTLPSTPDMTLHERLTAKPIVVQFATRSATVPVAVPPASRRPAPLPAPGSPLPASQPLPWLAKLQQWAAQQGHANQRN